ncbi:MAG: pitrilysin family protein [Mariprofundaceae bacterium]|nr:pitrilysin family protein [Mariprofundaceae bacterium]
MNPFKKIATLLSIAFLALYLPVMAFAMPAIESSHLKNGMKIMLMEAHQVPIVSMKLVFPAGSRMDKVHGTASLLADMLTDHTAKQDRNTWLNFIDQHALHLGASVSSDALYVNLSFLREDLSIAIQALQEVLQHSGWNAQRFDILKKQQLSYLQKSQENARTLATWEAKKKLYGKHPYAYPTSGSTQSVQNIQLKHLQALHQQQVQPSGATLAVSGDIDMKSLKEALQDLESTWLGSVQVKALEIAPTVHNRPFTSHIPMEKQQTTILMVRAGLAKHDPDTFPTIVLNQILGGGGFASQLMEEVREKRGLAYGVYSYFSSTAAVGRFSIMLKTRQDQSELAKKTVLDVLETMHQSINKKDLKAAKSNLMGSFAQRLDSNQERASTIATIGFYQLPETYLQNWTQQINSVNLADVNRVAKRFLKPESWSIVEVGSKSGGNKP